MWDDAETMPEWPNLEGGASTDRCLRPRDPAPVSSTLRRPAWRLAALVGLLCLAAPARAADALPFLAHQAVYDLKLDRGIGSKAPTAASGRIVYQFSGSPCDGYVTNFRQVTELQPAEGETRVSDQRSRTFEDSAAKLFRFRILSTIDNAAQDDVEGSATRASDGSLQLALSRPTARKLVLKPDIVFPTQHLERIIAAAKAGQRTLAIETYDGSDTGSKVEPSFAIIGPESREAMSDAATKIPALAGVRRWPISISYFESTKTDGLPDYRLSFELYENGVSDRLKLDYGDFILAGTLTSFKALSATPCKAK